MATSAFANVKGSVFKTEHREGFAKKTGAAYSMDIVTVLVPDGGLTELVLPEDSNRSVEALASLQGKPSDFLCEFFRNEFGFGIKVIRENTGLLNSARRAAPVAA